MIVQNLLFERRLAAVLLIACFIIFAVGGMLYTGRAIWKLPVAQTGAYLLWERSWIIAAALVNIMGFVALADLLQKVDHAILAQLALTVYVIGTAVLLAAEGAFLSNHQWISAQIILYVVLAFLAQAAFGVALLRTGLVPVWVAWATIVWNVGWLTVFAVIRPADIYYPALHHVAPVLIGVALLMNL